MPFKRHRIQFPQFEAHDLDQNEVYFYLIGEKERKRKIRFHDYDKIYKIPGLYEQIFYDRLKCNSPTKIVEILQSSIKQSEENMSELRVLDLGAGNGMLGEALSKYGVARIIGADIIPEAQEALERDRPHIYDDYYVADFCSLSDEKRESLTSWSFNCLVSVAALGFDDIPAKAFVEAFNLIQSKGWVAFNIKESFFNSAKAGDFSGLIHGLIYSEYLSLYHLERYRHRLSIEGEPIYYFAIAARKNKDIPDDWIRSQAGL